MTLLQAVILAIVEGVTEFLPVSSTGHMILTSTFFGIEQEETVKVFTVAIQLGAILSVLVLYWRRFLNISIPFYRNIIVASIPAVVLGFSLEKLIDQALGSPYVVVATLILGGVILIKIDDWIKAPERETDITPKQAFLVGCFQCLAMIPGTSRSASTIIGGMTQGLTRKQAAEFSFFLAVPIMCGATLLKVYKNRALITAESAQILLIGNLVAFVVALLVIKAFIGYLTRHGLKAFGYYRIVAGVLVLIALLYSK